MIKSAHKLTILLHVLLGVKSLAYYVKNDSKVYQEIIKVSKQTCSNSYHPISEQVYNDL